MPGLVLKSLSSAVLGLCLLVAQNVELRAQEGPPGITEPIVLAPFDPNAPRCGAPKGLRRVLAFARDNDRDFMNGVDRGLAAAAKDRGLEYLLSVANNDADKQTRQVEEFLSNKVGALVTAPVDPMSLAPHLQKLIWTGSYVGTIVPPPAISILNAPQYLAGKALGDAAAQHIRNKLGGKAKVVLLTHDSLEFLAPRFAAIRDSLRSVPGVTIVADISPETVDQKGGFNTMKTVLLADPDIDVVLGADTVVLGALAAVRASAKDHDGQFFGGIDGEPEAVAELKKPASPYKSSISLASPIFAYAMGQHAADWLEGKSIPQAMDILPFALNAENLARYEADIADPASVYADRSRRDAYLKMYGNICYDSRDRYLNFPWSSESR